MSETETTVEILDQIESQATPSQPVQKPKKPVAAATIIKSPMTIVAEAIALDVDLERLEKLIALAERLQAKQAKSEYTEAKIAAEGEMPRIVATKTNTSTGSKYAPLEEVCNGLKPIYLRHGFTLEYSEEDAPRPARENEQPNRRIVCTVRHKGGHEEVFRLDSKSDTLGPKGGAQKTEVQGLGSMVSYLRRYLMLMIFNISISQEDNDGNHNSAPWTEKQLHNVLELIARCRAAGEKVLDDKFIEFLAEMGKVEQGTVIKYADLPQSVYDEAISQLNKKLKAAEQKAADGK